MDSNPLVFDVAASLRTMSEVVANLNDRQLADGYIVTEDGRYFGTGKLTVTGAMSFEDNTSSNGNGAQAVISSTTGFLDLNGGLRNINVSGNNLGRDLNITAIVQNGGINFTGTESLAVAGQFGNRAAVVA